MPGHLNWVEIDLDEIRNNVRRLAELAGGARVMAVVKANAYGHGMLEVSRAAAGAGASWLGVARADEAVALRAGGLALPILVMGYTPPEQAAEAIGQAITLTVYDLETAQAYAAAAREQGRQASVHVKLDSGMGRLGVLPGEATELVVALHALDGLRVEGLFTHFAAADSNDQRVTLRQIGELEGVLEALGALGQRPPIVHACNSAGLFRQPRALYDLVRAGIALYGLHPSDEVQLPAVFRPALSWKVRVAQVKTLPPGHGVSYGPEYVTRTTERLAVLTVGYADGYRRVPKNVNEVLVRGRRAPVRGRVCMDQIVVGVDEIAGVRTGDAVVLLGTDGTEIISAEALARRWGTINYEVTSGILARVERVYV